MNRLISLGFCLFLLAACATSGTETIKDENRIGQLRKGVTTQNQVFNLFGEPQIRTKTDEGTEKWEYAYTYTELKGATFIPFVGLFAGGANADVNTLEIEFDKQNVIKGLTTGKGKISSHNFGHTESNIQKQER